MGQLVLANILAGSGNVLAGGDNSGNVTKVTIGSGLTLTSGVLASTGGGGSGTVTSVAMTVPTGLSIAGSPITTTGTLALTFATGYSIPTTAKQTNWDDAYTWVGAFPSQATNAGKFLTTNGSALSWAAITASVTSVFGRSGVVVAVSGDYDTDKVTEGTSNLYYTNARARAALSANTGSALTYNSTTGRYTLVAAATGISGYITGADYDYWNAKQASLGTGTVSQFLRGDLAWAAPPAPALGDLTNVVITTPSNGQLLRYQTGNWINFTPTYVAAGFFSATAPLSYNSTTGVFTIAQATTSTNGYLSSTDWNTFNGKQNQINGTGFVKATGTTISYDNSTYLTTSTAATTYLALTGGTLTGTLTSTGFFESSDKRLKTQLEANYAPQNIGDIQAYLYIKDGKEEVGYYAQEVSEVIPSAVVEGKDGFLSVAYNQVLVAKIQYLENKLNQLINELGRNSK
jgi:hypothetical protein